MANKFKDHNDVVYNITERASELANLSLPLLRARIPGTDTPEQAQREFRYWNRGKLIEHILLDEFVEEFPRKFEDD